MTANSLPLLARQPILDKSLRVTAYELLCRPVPSESLQWQQQSGNEATTEVVIGALHEVGMEAVTGGLPAFVNFTQEWLTRTPPLPPKQMVIELLEHIPFSDEHAAAVKKLKSKGYRIAVDDFIGDATQAKWLPYADIVKVDLLGLPDGTDAAMLIERFNRPGLIWLAEKVESYEDFNAAKAAGYTLFQGYFYSKPQIIYGKRTPDSHIAVMRLLKALNDQEQDIDDIIRIISEDPQLSFRLMQMANSAAFSGGRTVTSLIRATMQLGLDRIRSWASLLALGKLSDKPQALRYQALFRGHLAREISLHYPALEADTAFTLGLFSLLDAMMDTDLSDVCARLSLKKDLTSALTEHLGDYGVILATVIACDTGQLDAIPWHALPISEAELEACQEAALNMTGQSSNLIDEDQAAGKA
ncbi:EAL and HDOD domain-containing protein [uncultured Thalassolituus sp.]|uniref:EAL and HDOD domain-containing protein n=1 Tax=uncultured Thalassolituus sp. TaxID=285273 RepID=UPI00261199FA|nr:HDOD domain-containing protein [uncultured Thalassolituus sp.]